MYENAQYIAGCAGNIECIRVDINGTTSSIPLDPANTDYQNIMALVDAGELVIVPADTP